MRLFLFAATILISPVFAQSTGAGRTTITGTLDTRQPPPVIRGPANPPVRKVRLPIPLAELQSRQQELLRQRPAVVGPPGMEMVDRDARGLAPSEMPSQTLAANATRSFAGMEFTGLIPPSPDVAVGPEDVLQTVHSQIARYNKSGLKLSQVSLQQWFSCIAPGGVDSTLGVSVSH